jgi:hypothetical protein
MRSRRATGSSPWPGNRRLKPADGLSHRPERVYASQPDTKVSERSAARLAHRSGGPGVGSSNLPAPTIHPLSFRGLSAAPKKLVDPTRGTNRRQSARTGAKSPGIISNDVRGTFNVPCKSSPRLKRVSDLIKYSRISKDPPPQNANAAQSGRGGGAAKKTIRKNDRRPSYRPRLRFFQVWRAAR